MAPSLRHAPRKNANPRGKTARDRIVATATRLFGEQGSRAVGIDTVIAESGVAKMSLYRSFPSKDDLIAACLSDYDQKYWERWERTIAEHPGSPREQLRGVLRGIAERSSDPRYRGCIFLNTALDYAEPGHPGKKMAIRHKETLKTRLLAICEQIPGVRDPEALCRQLVLLINGAQATAGMLGRETQMELVSAADTLVEQQLKRRK